MHTELTMASADLANFLQDKLPRLSDDWWNKHVIDRLSFQQQRIVADKHIDSLDKLDIAALLRVFDQNWYDLSNVLNLPREARNWVKETQTIRNKWAHMSAGEIPASEIFRDADTLIRLLQIIKAKPETIARIKATQDKALSSMAGGKDTAAPQGQDDTKDAVVKTKNENQSLHLFKVGDVVTLRSDNSARLAVLDVLTGGREVRYSVLENGSKELYYESQLKAVADEADADSSISVEEFRARLTALHLLSPSTVNLFSLRSGRINFVPYQYRPVLKLIRSDRPRILIADEVGVGKTIEAGLILKELRARMDISSVLVICPKALVTERKWESEMKRFDEEFVHLDGPMMRHCIRETNLDGEWPSKYENAILPFSLFDTKLVYGEEGVNNHKNPGMINLDPAPEFDLVIVDEAHHIRNSDTLLHQGIRFLCEHAKAVVLMTATPVQLGSHDLYTLLNVLRPDLIIDERSFDNMAEPNRYINTAIQICRKKEDNWQTNAREQLKYAAETEWGRIFLREGENFQFAFDKLGESDLSDEDRINIIRSLEDTYTFSSIINRTRRRDIGDFTKRKPQTLTVEFTDEQEALHDDLLDVIARILEHCHGQQNVKFMMSTIRRQAASCLYGIAPFISDILHKNLARLLDGVAEIEDLENIDDSFIEYIRSQMKDIIKRAENLDPTDPKVKNFIDSLKDKASMENNKALVFSTFRHTLSYLAKHVEEAGLRYALVNGDVLDDDRRSFRARFALPKEDPSAIDVLLSSEVGSEGLDFQFCDFLVNYDLPWNPMRIEQRIGRIDRYGQESEAVSIVNIITPGTVDADIYERCLMRIGVFQHAIGGNEEILGRITKQINDIAESFILSDKDRLEKLQQVADNNIRIIKEEQDLEQKEADLFGLTVPNASWREDIKKAESEWLSADAIRHITSVYLKEKIDSAAEYLQGEKKVMSLRLSQQGRDILLKDFRALKKVRDLASRAWEKWLKGSSPNLPITFDQDTAYNEPKVTYLTAQHPLVRQAATYFDTRDPMHCTLEATMNEGIPAGRYKFALYRWKKAGIKKDEELVAVAEHKILEERLLEMLIKATEPIEKHSLKSADFEGLDDLHHAKWLLARTEYSAKNVEIIAHRTESLTVSHRARIGALEDQLKKTTNEKIRVMKKGEIQGANADFDRRVAELQEAENSGDIQASPVLFGTLIVK